MTDITLKAEQRSAMEAIYNRQDVFVWLPTGYGKSLCYQVLPFIIDYRHGVVETQRHSLVLVAGGFSSSDGRSALNRSHSYILNVIKFTCMRHFCHYVIISTLIMCMQTVCIRPSPPPILEGLGTRLAFT